MSQIGHVSNDFDVYPSLRAQAQMRVNTHVVDRLEGSPLNTPIPGGAGNPTSCIGGATCGTVCNGATTQEAKRLADYYELVLERSLTTQHWKPA